MSAKDFSFNGIDVNLNTNLVNDDNFDTRYTHYNNLFWYEYQSYIPYNKFNSTSLSKFLSIPQGFKAYIDNEVHIPYPPEFFIKVLDINKLKNNHEINLKYLNIFLKNYLNEFSTDSKKVNAISKSDPGIIYMRREFKKLRQRWETDIVESLRIAYTQYKLKRYDENNKKKEDDKEKEVKEFLGGELRTQEFRDFGQNLLKPDEIWNDFIHILKDNEIYRSAGSVDSANSETSATTTSATNKNKVEFEDIFKITGDNNDHFYSGTNFIGHRFKLLNIRYLWKYAKRVLESDDSNTIIGNNSLDAELGEWKKLMGYSDTSDQNDNNRVGDIIKNFLHYNKDLIRKDDCIQEELISNYKDAIATTYWNDKNDTEDIQNWRSPIIWIIVVLISYRIINVFFSMIKKDETGTSGFVYKVKDMGMIGGLNDIFKYGNNGKITIHTPYSVLSPYWSLIRNNEWLKEKLIQGYTEERKVINSMGKDGPYVPHSMDSHTPGSLHDSIYLKSADKKEELTLAKLFQYMSCITIGFWFSLLENKLFEYLRGEVGKYGEKKWLNLSKPWLILKIIFWTVVGAFVATLAGGGLGILMLVIGSFIILLFYIYYTYIRGCLLYDIIKNNFTQGNKELLTLFALSLFFLAIAIVSLYFFFNNLNFNDFDLRKIAPAIGMLISYQCLGGLSIYYLFEIKLPDNKINQHEKFKFLDTLFSRPILEDYLKLKIPDNPKFLNKNEKMSWFKKIGIIALANFTMFSGLIWAILKSLPLSLYVFLWSSPKMKGEPGNDNVSKLLNNFGVGALIVIFGLLVWIVHNVYITNRNEGNIYVKRNAIISAMPHMAHKIQRFKYDALFTGFKRKMTLAEHKKKYEQLADNYRNDMEWEIEGEDKPMSYDEMKNIYDNKDVPANKEKWNKIAPKYYQIEDQLKQFDSKKNMKNNDFIGCLDDDNYKYRAPPLGVIGIVMFVFAAQMAMSHITLPEVPKMPNFGDSGASGDSDASGDSEDSKRSGKWNHRMLRILFIFLITVCVLIIWSIEFLPQLLITMNKKDGDTEYDINKWMLIPIIGVVSIIGILILVYMYKN